MSNVTEILEDFRFDANADTSQITDTQALMLLNRVYREFINEIRSINEDYFYNYWIVNSSQAQEEYKLEARTSEIPGIVKIKALGIKYKDTDTNYTKVKLETQNNLPQDLMYYKDNQPKSSPFFTISDNSVFIYPAPDENVTDGIILYGISDPIDLTLATTEDNIKIPLEYHYLLPMAMKRYYFASRFMINEKNDTLMELNGEKQKMLKNLGTRKISPVQITEPILSNLY